MPGMQSLPKILLVEDDQSITAALLEALKTSYDVDAVANGKSALYKIEARHYDIIILDLGLPDMSGAKLCNELREQGVNLPILILSADCQVLTKINLLDSGANDYLAKPFSLGELKARLRVLTRVKHKPMKLSAPLAVGDILLNRRSHHVSRQGMTIKLRRKEFALLECLMEHAGSVVTRRTLTHYAWQDDDLWTNTIDVHIKYLRDKIDRPFDKPVIKTVHGLGYKLEAVPSLSTIKT